MKTVLLSKEELACLLDSQNIGKTELMSYLAMKALRGENHRLWRGKQVDIADFSAIPQCSVSKAIKKLANKKMITREGRKVGFPMED